jgi:hypothetical protein
MANISTMGRATYTLTVQDVANGFFAVPILWDTPFNDTNYICSWSVLDEYFPAPSLDFGQGDIHYKRGDGFIAVVTIPGAAPIVQGQWDDFDEDTPITLTFQPLVSTLYQISIYLHAKTGENSGNNPLDALGSTISFQAETGEFLSVAGPTITALQASPSSATEPIYSTTGGNPITITTAFLTSSIPGDYVDDTSYAVGTFVSTPFTYGELITQANTGATATYYGYVSGNIVYGLVSGVDDFASNWSDAAHYVFTNGGGQTASADGFYNTGATVVQSVSGASALTLNASGTSNNDFYVGSVSGVFDSTHAIIDNSIFAVYMPTGAIVPGVPFHYHISARIVQMPNSAVTPQVGAQVTVEAMASHR